MSGGVLRKILIGLMVAGTIAASDFVYNSRQVRLTTEDFPKRSDTIFLLERDTSFFNYVALGFEKRYDGIPLLLWSRSHYWLAPVFCFAYLALITVGPKWMANRPAYKLDKPLRYWNLLLAIYSALGASRMLPHTLLLLYRFGWQAGLCSPPVFTYGRGSAGLWTGLFIYSKYFELVDTAFIILRKRNLNFLHWYHHVTVLLYTWDAFVTEQPPGLFYCAMNYGVHSIMYYYYYLAESKRKPTWGIFVTILQLAQMVAGVAITAVSLKNAFTLPFMHVSTREIAEDPSIEGTCYIGKMNMISAAAMYSTYFYLFAEFFYKRYIAKSAKRQQHTAKKLE